MRVPRIVMASAAAAAVSIGALVSLSADVSAQTATATATGTATGTATATATGTGTATATATGTATGTATATSTAAATGTATRVPTATGTAVQVQPVVVSIPSSVYSTPGTLTAYVNGQPCGTVTVTGSSAATLNLPANCTVPGAVISFQTSGGTTLGQTATIPQLGGAVALGAQATATSAAPRPPATGNGGVMGGESSRSTAVLVLIGALAVGAGAAARRFAR